jgi:TolB-like protein/Flp pilus assembly protein TadD
MAVQPDPTVRFGPFELDVRSGELKKQGRRVRLQDQPLLVLQALLERRGDLVTRDELRRRLWPDNTFVDFEDGLNTAVMRLREALGDVAKRPRYIETRPRRGYRFIAAIEAAPAARAIASIRSVAVLPLENLSLDPDEEVFADAMTDELITSLAKASSLRVISRASVMAFKKSRTPLPEIGRALGVDALVEGTVIRAGHRVRVTAQLIEAAADRHLWADSYEGDLRDILALQRDMANAIAGEISANLSARQRASGIDPPLRPVNPDAYLAYVKGRAFWDQRHEAALLKGVAAFAQAVAIDARYAAAYAGLADCYTALGYGSYLAPRAAFEHASAAAQKALAIDPELAGAEAPLGYVALYYHWNAGEADQRFRRTLTLDPASVTAHHWYSVYLTAMSRFDEARAEIRRALELDPLSHAVNTDAGFVAYYSGRYDEAVAHLRAVLSLAPHFPLAHLWLGRAYQAQGRLDEAVREFAETRRVVGDWPVVVAAMGHALGASGRHAEARQQLDTLDQLSRHRYVTEYGVALIHAGLGDAAAAFDWLDRAVAARSHWLVWLDLDPRWQALRHDPRFAAVVGRVGLAPAQGAGHRGLGAEEHLSALDDDRAELFNLRRRDPLADEG